MVSDGLSGANLPLEAIIDDRVKAQDCRVGHRIVAEADDVTVFQLSWSKEETVIDEDDAAVVPGAYEKLLVIC